MREMKLSLLQKESSRLTVALSMKRRPENHQCRQNNKTRLLPRTLTQKKTAGERVQTFSYKMTRFWGYNIQHGDYS